jgi:hypothetical protein
MMPTSPGKPGTAENPLKKRRLGLAEQIMIGLVLGVAAGSFSARR